MGKTKKAPGDIVPQDERDGLGPYGPQTQDGHCGETNGWGYLIKRRLGPERWEQLAKYGEMVCLDVSGGIGNFLLITKHLTATEAIEKYGKVTKIVTDWQGGFRSATFGDKTFMCATIEQAYKRGELDGPTEIA